MTKTLRVALVAALLTGAAATAASAEPPRPGASCRIEMGPPMADHNIPGVPGFPGTPYLECYY